MHYANTDEEMVSQNQRHTVGFHLRRRWLVSIIR
jgi:hypothetical protein